MADMWSDIDRVAPLANKGQDPRGQGSRPRPRPRPRPGPSRPRPRPGASRPRPRTYIFVLEDPRGQGLASRTTSLVNVLVKYTDYKVESIKCPKRSGSCLLC